MSKILNLDNLLEVSETVLDAEVHQRHVDLQQAAMTMLAADLAAKLNIHLKDVSYQPGFAGLCATFDPMYEHQPCPGEIHAGDPTGDWGDEWDEQNPNIGVTT